jgi:glucokinase
LSEIVAIDIGGTHARFAIARVGGGRVAELGAECTLETAAYATFEDAYDSFANRAGRPLPDAAAVALAGPIEGEPLKLTNNPWLIRPSLLRERLNGGCLLLVNDFAAVAHAVAQVDATYFRPICGPDGLLPNVGVATIVGPGTGLGVAQLIRGDGGYRVVATEGGHIGFAPVDALDDAVLGRLRERYGRVSAERVASGPGLRNIYETLCGIGGQPSGAGDDRAIWRAAIAGEDPVAKAALDRFCLKLGAVAGDIALAHGAQAVVIAGGVGLRLAGHLRGSSFRAGFLAKGRFARHMKEMPVSILTHPQPGLFGAAAAFAAEYPD